MNTISNIKHTLLLLPIVAVFLLSGCVDTSKVNNVVIKPKKSVTFCLIDNSLSYNNPNDSNSQRVIKMVKDEIIAKLKEAVVGERIIVRTIQSESNQLSAMISHLDLTADDLYFEKPKPTNPIELKVWEKEKREFEDSLDSRIESDRQKAISDFLESCQPVLSEPSNKTDFIGALLTCQRFFDKRDYDGKKLYIYSDMVEDAALEDESQLDLSGVTVEARFVTKPVSEGAAHTHQYFKVLEQRWDQKLNADEFVLYEVQNSF